MTNQIITEPADRTDEIQLVVDVRSELGLDPIDEEAMRLGARWMNTYCLPIPDLLLVDGVVIA